MFLFNFFKSTSCESLLLPLLPFLPSFLLSFRLPPLQLIFYFLTSSAIRVFCCAIFDVVYNLPRANFGAVSGFVVGFDVGATRLGVTFDAAVAVKVGLDGADRLIGFGFDSTSINVRD